MKEYLEGRNLITKLQAKHDLLQKTLGESECVMLLLETSS
jgi:SLIT-ROBO Rho GTPase activating protein